MSSIVFFIGILLAVATLEHTHILTSLAQWLDRTVGRLDVIVMIIGMVSAIVDNVPLVAASMGMYSLTQYPARSFSLGVPGLLRRHRWLHSDHWISGRRRRHGTGEDSLLLVCKEDQLAGSDWLFCGSGGVPAPVSNAALTWPMPVQPFKTVVVSGFRTWALPRLTELPESKWDEAIQKAQAIDFDVEERIALIIGVVGVTYLLRTDAGTVRTFSLPYLFLVQFVEAAFLLILLVGPFYLRRARRGLDSFIAEHGRVRKQ